MHVYSLRERLLAGVAAEVVICKLCPLSKSRNKAVPGEGNAEARIMLVGEAPGSSENLQGRPFVGAAGKFLETLLSEIGLSREEVFICNIVKCRPPRNRLPKPLEVQTCTPYLERQIEIISPEFLVTLGSCSTGYIFSIAGFPFAGITAVRGKKRQATLHGVRMTIFPTFHPAAALYSPKYKEQITADFKILKKELGKRRNI
jgi:uracil-DNA glycosylase family 4